MVDGSLQVYAKHSFREIKHRGGKARVVLSHRNDAMVQLMSVEPPSAVEQMCRGLSTTPAPLMLRLVRHQFLARQQWRSHTINATKARAQNLTEGKGVMVEDLTIGNEITNCRQFEVLLPLPVQVKVEALGTAVAQHENHLITIGISTGKENESIQAEHQDQEVSVVRRGAGRKPCLMIPISIGKLRGIEGPVIDMRSIELDAKHPMVRGTKNIQGCPDARRPQSRQVTISQALGMEVDDRRVEDTRQETGRNLWGA